MFRFRLILALVMVAALCCFPGGTVAAVSFSGILDGTYPTWSRVSDRSDGVGGFLDSANDSLPYEVLEIRTTVSGDTLTAAIAGGTQFDSFLALYSQFNPLTPLANILAADDDSGGYPHALLTKSGLAANTSYFLVISNYAGAGDSVYPLYGSYGLNLGGSFTVVPKSTTTSIDVSSNPSAVGQAITLTSTVTKLSGIAVPTGTVTFYDGATPLGTGALNTISQASLTTSSLTVGTHSVFASYNGEARYSMSTSTPVSVIVEIPLTLHVTFAGNGSGKVESTAPDTAINCSKGSPSSCSASYLPGTSVTVSATEDWKSTFIGWNNGVISNANPVTFSLDFDLIVSATFDPNNKARVMPDAALFASIQDAYVSVPSGSMTIQAQVWSFLEDVVFGNVTAVTLTGGTDASYNPNLGYSTVKSLTLEMGSLVISNIIIR
jgi:hypothetical protein